MSSHRHLLIVLSAVAVGIALLLVTVNRFATPLQQPAAPLFAANYPDGEGRSQTLAQWRHEVLVVNFWASWCPPCREEMPELSRLHAQYHGQGLTVVGISTDDAAKMQQFTQTTRVSYPLLAADLAGMDLAVQLGGPSGTLPYTVVVDRNGNLVSRHVGRIDYATLEQAIRPLL